MTATDICPACGYPMVGVDLCAYCVPVQAINGQRSSESLHAVGRPRFVPRRLLSPDHSKPDVAESNQLLVGGVACPPVAGLDAPEPHPPPPPQNICFEVVTFL